MYKRQRLPVTWPFWVFGGLAAALCLYILARAFATQQPKAAPGFVTAPPDGISPAEVGYIIDGSADDSDLVSLILQFAQQGLVTLENVPDEKGDILVLHKKGELPAAAPDYQRTFWQGLFPLPDSTVCDMGEWKPEFFETMQQAKQQLAATFQGGRQLDRKGTAAQAILLPLPVCALYLAAVLFSGCLLYTSTNSGSTRRSAGPAFRPVPHRPDGSASIRPAPKRRKCLPGGRRSPAGRPPCTGPRLLPRYAPRPPPALSTCLLYTSRCV